MDSEDQKLLIVSKNEAFALEIGKYLSDKNLFREIHQVARGSDAITLARERILKLLIIDEPLPDMSTLELLAELRAKDFRVATLVLLERLSGSSYRETIENGALFVLDKPASPQNIEALLKKAFGILQTSRDLGSCFVGHIDQIELPEIIQFLCLTRWTGKLRISSYDGRTGSLAFQDGNLSDASTQHMQGRDAVHEILTWSDIEFYPEDTPPGQATISEGWEYLLMDAMSSVDVSRPKTKYTKPKEQEDQTGPSGFEKQFSNGEILEILERTRQESGAYIACLLKDDGIPVGLSVGPGEDTPDQIWASIIDGVNRFNLLGKEINAGDLDQAMFEYSEKTILFRRIQNSRFLLLVIADFHSVAGQIRVIVGQAVADLGNRVRASDFITS